VNSTYVMVSILIWTDPLLIKQWGEFIGTMIMLDVEKAVFPKSGCRTAAMFQLVMQICIRSTDCVYRVPLRWLDVIDSKNIDIERHKNIDCWFPFYKVKKRIE
jgi:hypothetical protein